MLPALYAVTLFVGAALLFLVQPLVGKLLLPLVGGTPGVWNTCMVFFQTVLLAGYLYAHRSVTKIGVRRQAVFHLFVLIIDQTEENLDPKSIFDELVGLFLTAKNKRQVILVTHNANRTHRIA